MKHKKLIRKSIGGTIIATFFGAMLWEKSLRYGWLVSVASLAGAISITAIIIFAVWLIVYDD